MLSEAARCVNTCVASVIVNNNDHQVQKNHQNMPCDVVLFLNIYKKCDIFFYEVN